VLKRFNSLKRKGLASVFGGVSAKWHRCHQFVQIEMSDRDNSKLRREKKLMERTKNRGQSHGASARRLAWERRSQNLMRPSN
jgi:hypothetical protein